MTDYPRFSVVRGDIDTMYRAYHGARLVELVLRASDRWLMVKSTGAAQPFHSTRVHMKTVKTIGFAAVAISVLAVTAVLAPASGHDWYPLECCSQLDCAPVESVVRLVPAGGGAPQLVVTSKHGKATLRHDYIPRASKDSRMHVCMRRNDTGDMDVICFFMPPGA